jgi:flagella basal body P-ring formation protein FlgA
MKIAAANPMNERLVRGLLAFAMVAVTTLPLLGRPELRSLTVVEQVAVDGSKIFLTDLLTRESLSVLADNRLGVTPVALSPLPGKAKMVDGRTVQERLAGLGITSDRFAIRIPERIRIERLAQTLSPADIEGLVRGQFLPGLPWQEVRLEEMSISEPTMLPNGQLEVAFQRPPRTDLARPFYLNIDFRVDGQLVKRAYVRTVLTILDSVPVAVRDISAAERITPDDVRWEKRALRSTLQTPIRNVTFFEGRKPRTRIAAGEPLTEEMFMTVPLVRRGDNVTVVFDDGRIRISTRGQSLGAGARGDLIRVVNIDSRAQLLAEIVDEKTVRIAATPQERIVQ